MAPQFFIFGGTYFSFGLILRDIPNSITSQTQPPPATDFGWTARTPLLPNPLFFLSQTEESAKAGICARDRHALQQLALNVHVKHSDLT